MTGSGRLLSTDSYAASLEEAATRLGKSVRQVRYMVQQGRLEARKVAGRYVIEADDLPLSAGQQDARDRKLHNLRAAVEEGLALPADTKSQRFSVRDLKAFQIALPLLRGTGDALGAGHAASRALREVVEHLARGCHRYDYAEKATAYREARDAASRAVCELVLAEHAAGEALVQAIEQELMAAIAGLLRRLDRKRLR